MQRAKHTFVPALAALALVFSIFASRAVAQQPLPYFGTPLFQYAIFYNLNLEIDPGAGFPIEAPVFSNAGIWSGTPNTTFSSTVQAVGTVNTSGTDPYCIGKADSGMPSSNFLYPGQPVSGAISANYPSDLPVITNSEALINLPPAAIRAPLSLAYEETNQAYFFNATSLIVSNWYYGTNGVAPWSNNFTVYLQDSFISPYAVMQDGVPVHWVELTNDYYIVSNSASHFLFVTNYVPYFHFTNNVSSIQWTGNPSGLNSVWYAGFSFLTNASFYDFRENAQAQAVQLDVGKLGVWITNNTLNAGGNWNAELCDDTLHGINSVFVYNAVPFIGQQQLPAVRLVDGQLLPSSIVSFFDTPIITVGLTVVTPQPLYVLGDYNVQTNGGPVVSGSSNTANTYPAALMADAITILSSSWVDQTASAAGTYYYTRPSSNTTINAACFEGIVPSVGSAYSGGVENFERLLQDWRGDVLTYNGSIAVIFSSIYATNPWGAPSDATSYYSAPIRNWGFDTNFLISSQDLPPLTPTIFNSNSLPAIISEPTNQIAIAGATATFSVTVTNELFTPGYQWQLNGTNLPDYSNVLVLTNVNATNAGNYDVVVSSYFGFGGTTSSNAVLSVYSSVAPAISQFSFSRSNGLQFTVSGVPGYNYAVLASSNLVNWVPLITNNSPFNFADTNLDLPYRFYRSVYLP